MPRVSRLLGKPVPPDPAQVAQAIARRTGNRIIPTDAQTANRLGLTTQVQAKNVFLTDGGKKRRVTVGNRSIELRPVVVRHFSHNESESVIQGLRFVGESNITNAIIGKLRGELTASQKAALRRKIGNAPEWMRDALKT